MTDVRNLNARALSPGEVLLRTKAGAVCGSDLPLFRERASIWHQGALDGWEPPPGYPMHEIFGLVIASRDPEIPIGCDAVGWASGFDAMAELVVTAGEGLIAYAGSLPSELAIVAQSLACVLYAVEQLNDVSGTTVVVVGQGPIGLLFDHVLKSRGATRVVGIDVVDKRGIGRRFGADEVHQISSQDWAGEYFRDIPEIIIESVGHQPGTIRDAIASVATCGQIYYFGIPDEEPVTFDLNLFLRKNLTLRSGVTLDRRRFLGDSVRYLDAHPNLALDLITHTIPVSNSQVAFSQACRPSANQGKIVLTVPE